ncbi:MAG: leucyl aminopeptidase [Polyangiaceae bacterium]|nr:leucyl aminopeptidase [Polyangiaceae bacterium]
MTLRVELSKDDPSEQELDLLVIGVYEGSLAKQARAAALNTKLNGALMDEADRVEFGGTADALLDLPTLGALPAKRIMLVGLGPKRGMNNARLRRFAAVVARAAGSTEAITLCLPAGVDGKSLRAIAEGLALGAYRFTKYFTGDRAAKKSLGLVTVVKASGRPNKTEQRAVDTGLQIAAAVCIARDAVNEPPNELTPEALAQLAKKIAKQGKLKIKVLDKKGIAAAGMKLHYAVGQGSANEPRFIHMTYTPKKAKRTIAFVGKGLTFDSGGLCIKPAAGMGDMKSDMGGAAAVLGLMAAVAAVAPNVAVHGIIGAAENMPDAEAYRPGDVFGSLDGKTVEIINTDAEGRLVLADALAYTRDLKPDLIVDAATLTGAVVVALGKTTSAFYTAQEGLAREFDKSAKVAGENFWRMPLLEELRDSLKSDIADLRHTGERWGGSISAALFLREFVGDVPWIHCDVAAPVLGDRPNGTYPKGGTGHPVLTFLELVEGSA